MAALRKIQSDLDEQKTTIAKSAYEITEKVTKNINTILDTKIKIWEENQEKLKEKIENQEERLYILEKQARQRNVVFFGIEENERSYAQLGKNYATKKSFIEYHLLRQGRLPSAHTRKTKNTSGTSKN